MDSDPASTVDALARLARGQDPAAWAWIVDRHGARMLAAAQAITGERALAEDAVQEAFIAVRRGAGRFRAAPADPERGAVAWIAHAACFAALHLSRERRRRSDRERSYAMQATPPGSGEAPDPETLDRLRRGLAELPARHREPLALHFLGGLGYEDLAGRLGTTVNAARVRVHRALDQLRRKLGLPASEDSSTTGAMLLVLTQQPAPPDAALIASWKALGISKLAPATGTVGMGIAKGALVAAAFTVAIAAMAWNPPLPETVDTERARDERAYREEYLPVKAALETTAKGRWVAIADGHALRDGGAVATYESLLAADTAAGRAAPAARHRFLFQVASDGDSADDLGGTGERLVVGSGLLSRFGSSSWNGATGEFRMTAAGVDDPASLRRVGPDTELGGFIEAAVSDPEDAAATDELFQASGYSGTAVLPPSLARDLALERWEIPGVARLTGLLQADAGRRATMRFRIAPLGFDATVPVAVWSQEGHRVRRVESPPMPAGAEPSERADAGRLIDLVAYRQTYLPEKARLEREAAGRWIAIGGGAVTQDGGTIATFASAAEADRAVPLPAHRFIFQVGDDGDRVQRLGMSGRRCVVGSALLKLVPGLATYAVQGVYANDAGGEATLIGPPALGGAVIAFACGDPLAAAAGVPARRTVEEFWPSSVYDGGALLPPSLAADLRLERWEVPGSTRIGESPQSGDCRRANLSVAIPAIKFTALCPATIWPIEGRTFRDIRR